MQFNWIDWSILIIVAYYNIVGWQSGFVYVFSHFAAFILSLWFTVKYQAIVGSFLIEKFGVKGAWAPVFGFAVLSIGSTILLSEFFRYLTKRIPASFSTRPENRLLGSVFSIVNGLIIVSFVLLFILILPFTGSVKKDIEKSKIGSILVQMVKRYGGEVTSSFDSVASETVKYLTIKPNSHENVLLDVSPDPNQLMIDLYSENRMLTLINQERDTAGLPRFQVDKRLQEAARFHSRDMFERRYFSHYDPDGHDPVYRVQEQQAHYTSIGENIAYGALLDDIHEKLMASPDHRENLLDPDFRFIGIGIIDAQSNGKMVTQVFGV